MLVTDLSRMNAVRAYFEWMPIRNVADKERIYRRFEFGNLVSLWLDNDCMQWVCDCAGLPNTTCNNGYCELAYCYDPNPAGCFANGCLENYGCVDFEEAGGCVPSWCSCDEFYGDWFCTEDCNGGTCFQLGDVNYDSHLDILDIVLIISYILGSEDFSMSQIELTDWNGDSEINILDVISIINIILN